MNETGRMTGQQALRMKMKPELVLRIPGFEETEKGRTVVQYVLNGRTCEEWYRATEDKLLSQLGKGYYPVFRFSDGECYFCLGYRIPPPSPGQIPAIHYARTALSAFLKYRCYNTFWSGQPGYGYEVYRGHQWMELRKQFAGQLREIAKDGMIAGNFCRHHIRAMIDRYIPDIFDWFDAVDIELNAGNYIPFYFIYAVFLGPRRREFLENRKILVVTHLTPEKQERLRKYFKEAGAARIQFAGISRSNSMTDRIELLAEYEGVDLVLVGAGVGAANILNQVKPLGALSIDAGYVLECYQNPEFKGTRVFTLSDEDARLRAAALSEPVTAA